MANLNGTLNLLKLNGARLISLRGGAERGIFIPTEGENRNPSIYVGGKGAYMHVRVVESERDFNGKHYTHFIAAAFADGEEFKEMKEALGRDAINALAPILGNLESFKQPGGGSYEEEAEDNNDMPDFLR